MFRLHLKFLIILFLFLFYIIFGAFIKVLTDLWCSGTVEVAGLTQGSASYTCGPAAAVYK